MCLCLLYVTPAERKRLWNVCVARIFRLDASDACWRTGRRFCTRLFVVILSHKFFKTNSDFASRDEAQEAAFMIHAVVRVPYMCSCAGDEWRRAATRATRLLLCHDNRRKHTADSELWCFQQAETKTDWLRTGLVTQRGPSCPDWR